jgi:hypothetical protein
VTVKAAVKDTSARAGAVGVELIVGSVISLLQEVNRSPATAKNIVNINFIFFIFIFLKR